MGEGLEAGEKGITVMNVVMERKGREERKENEWR